MLLDIKTHLDRVVVKVSNDNVTTGRSNGTEVWASQLFRFAQTATTELVKKSTVGLEYEESTGPVVNDNDSSIRVTRDTFRTKKFANTNSESAKRTQFMSLEFILDRSMKKVNQY